MCLCACIIFVCKKEFTRPFLHNIISMTDKHMFLSLALCQESAPFASQIKTILMRREINLLQLRPLCLPTTGRSVRAGSAAWPSKKNILVIRPKWLDVVDIYHTSPEVVGFTRGQTSDQRPSDGGGFRPWQLSPAADCCLIRSTTRISKNAVLRNEKVLAPYQKWGFDYFFFFPEPPVSCSHGCLRALQM